MNGRHSCELVLVLLLILPVICLGNGSDSEVHDVAVTQVTAWPDLTLPSYVRVNVTVENEGTVPETFNVTVYADNLTVTSVTVADLAPGSNETLKLKCNLFPSRSVLFNLSIARAPRGQPMIVNVTMRAEASVIAGEVNTVNNVHVGGTISIIWCFVDFNGDGRINILDIAIIAKALFPPPSWGVHPLLDCNGDGRIDILDLAYTAKLYGWVYYKPPSNLDDP